LRYRRKIFAKGLKEYTEKILLHIPEFYPDIKYTKIPYKESRYLVERISCIGLNEKEILVYFRASRKRRQRATAINILIGLRCSSASAGEILFFLVIV